MQTKWGWDGIDDPFNCAGCRLTSTKLAVVFDVLLLFAFTDFISPLIARLTLWGGGLLCVQFTWAYSGPLCLLRSSCTRAARCTVGSFFICRGPLMCTRSGLRLACCHRVTATLRPFFVFISRNWTYGLCTRGRPIVRGKWRHRVLGIYAVLGPLCSLNVVQWSVYLVSLYWKFSDLFRTYSFVWWRPPWPPFVDPEIDRSSRSSRSFGGRVESTQGPKVEKPTEEKRAELSLCWTNNKHVKLTNLAGTYLTASSVLCEAMFLS